LRYGTDFSGYVRWRANPLTKRDGDPAGSKHPTRGGLWLFDCGEGTQHQLLHTAYHPGKLDKIFITHLHGDHLFGLPGLLCSRSMAGNANPLTIYGPAGIREFVETTLRLSGSWTDYPLEVVEIAEGLVFDDEDYRVTAQPLNHPVECYGYRIDAHDKPGALDAAALMADGKTRPLFQRLKHGETVTLEDGRVINGRIISPHRSPAKSWRFLAIRPHARQRSRWLRAWT
jgi:ribonuclease Z